MRPPGNGLIEVEEQRWMISGLGGCLAPSRGKGGGQFGLLFDEFSIAVGSARRVDENQVTGPRQQIDQ